MDGRGMLWVAAVLRHAVGVPSEQGFCAPSVCWWLGGDAAPAHAVLCLVRVKVAITIPGVKLCVCADC
jgi:hypothetical protein